MSDLDKEELEATRNMGKTANELSEKEIIQHFEFIKSGIKEETKFIDISILEYFEGLLDLYQKEKEKNKKLIEGQTKTLEKLLIPELLKNYIRKDKIKEKIEELDKEEEDLQNSISDEEREEYSDANISWKLMDIQIRREVLQSLLEKKKKELLEEE